MNAPKSSIIYMLILVGFTVLIILMMLQGCAKKNVKTNIQIKYNFSQVDTANVQADFELAIKEKRFRFLGIYGYSTRIPGLSRQYEKIFLLDSTRIRMLEGTSDAIVSEEHERYLRCAEKYAYQYNILLFKHLKDHGMIQK